MMQYYLQLIPQGVATDQYSTQKQLILPKKRCVEEGTLKNRVMQELIELNRE
jgi:hypothetical protein